jgi:integrase
MGQLAVTPVARVRLPRATRAEMCYLTPIELEVLAAAIDPRWRAMVLAMAWTTLRMGEACGIRRVDVDAVSGTLRSCQQRRRGGWTAYRGAT